MTDHPAPYTDALLPIMAELLLKSDGYSVDAGPGPAKILDPFAGTGKIARLRAWLSPSGDLMSPEGPQAEFYGYEIEPEWAEQARAAGCACTTGDSRHMHYPDATFDAICTSPTYGNRMADHHEARDASPRHTYRHVLGRPLTPGNSGALQWGDGIAGEEYRALHVAVWTECRRVLKPGGIFVLNVKDHIRGGVLQEVSNWHAVTLLMLGFVCTRRVHVPCPGQRHGANGHLRVDYESVIQLRSAT
jgi:SAM-dependent methyltransferase